MTFLIVPTFDDCVYILHFIGSNDSMHLDANIIPSVTEMKDLGITVDDKLT